MKLNSGPTQPDPLPTVGSSRFQRQVPKRNGHTQLGTLRRDVPVGKSTEHNECMVAYRNGDALGFRSCRATHWRAEHPPVDGAWLDDEAVVFDARRAPHVDMLQSAY